MNGQTAFSTLVNQTELDDDVAEIYSPGNPVELSRITLANTTSSRQTVTLYHQLASVDADTDPTDAEVAAVHTIEPYGTIIDPDQSRGAAITLQQGDRLWAKAVTTGAAEDDDSGGGGFSPTLIGSATFAVNPSNQWTHGVSALTVPAATEYGWLMFRGKISGRGVQSPAFFSVADFDSLGASTNGSTVSPANSLRGNFISYDPGNANFLDLLGITSTRRLLYSSTSSNDDATPLEMWGFAAASASGEGGASGSVDQVDGVTLSLYATPQNTAPIPRPYGTG